MRRQDHVLSRQPKFVDICHLPQTVWPDGVIRASSLSCKGDRVSKRLLHSPVNQRTSNRQIRDLYPVTDEAIETDNRDPL